MFFHKILSTSWDLFEKNLNESAQNDTMCIVDCISGLYFLCCCYLTQLHVGNPENTMMRVQTVKKP